MLTVATGNLSNTESDRAGLVTTHAYAVLNLIEIQVLFAIPVCLLLAHNVCVCVINNYINCIYVCKTTGAKTFAVEKSMESQKMEGKHSRVPSLTCK